VVKMLGEVRKCEWYIGTSGFSFSDWIGTVYPNNIKNSEMFTYYWQHYGFNCVELNFTFYQMPSHKTIISLLRKSPGGFKFAIKLHGSITHDGTLSNIDNFIKNTRIIEEEEKLIGYLAQFPYTFKFNTENIDFLRKLAEKLREYDLFIEFRNSSWVKRDEIFYLKEEFSNLYFVIVDLPKIPGLYPLYIDYSKNDKLLYLRMHGRNPNWFKTDEKLRYDYNYSDEELLDITNLILHFFAPTRLVFFNNCYRGQALKNALSFRKHVGGEVIGIF